MGRNSHIQWTTDTNNTAHGCTRISEGCLNCYIDRQPPLRMNAMRFDDRGEPAHRIGASTGVVLRASAIDAPLRMRTPRRIFLNSLTDLFHDEIPTGHIAEVFAVAALTPQHTYQVLTKRPARMRALMNSAGFWYTVGREARRRGYVFDRAANFLADGRNIYDTATWDELRFLPNVHLGVSVETQKRAENRIPLLLETPAALRFLSLEPLLEPVDLAEWVSYRCPVCQRARPWTDARAGASGEDADEYGCQVCAAESALQACAAPQLGWAILGGESGPGARACDPGWIAALLAQLGQAHVPAFVKQLGTAWARQAGAAHHKGGDPAEWPEHLRVLQFPTEVGPSSTERTGGR